jgi:hypothetical protein
MLLAGLMSITPRMLAAQQPPATGAAPTAATPLDMSYAIPQANILVAIRPAQILNSPAAQMYPVEMLQAALKKEADLDPLAAEQMVISVALPSYSVVTKFSAPQTLKPGGLTEGTQQTTFNDRPYFQSAQANPMLPSFFQPDDKTLIAAPDAMLRRVAITKFAAPPESLVAQFAAAAQGDDLLAMVDVGSMRPLINMAMMQAQIPPEMAQLRDIPNLVKLVKLRLNLTKSGLTELIVTANNEADAQQLVFMFESHKQQMTAQAAAEAQRALASDDPVEQARGRYIERMIKVGDQQFQLQREGAELILVRTDVHSAEGNQLVYVATVGVLVALLLPAVQAAREAARRNASMNNLKQIMLAMHNYHDVKKSFPAHAIYSADGKPLLSWRVSLLPYMEQQALYKQFHLDEPWDSEHNKQLIEQMPEVFLDPSSGLLLVDGKTHYLGVKGEGMFFDGTANGRKIQSITDGTSNSIAAFQVGDANAVIWTKPEDWELDADDPLAGIGMLHSGIFLAGFCDGHVQAISNAIDGGIFKNLLTVGGGEVVNVP